MNEAKAALITINFDSGEVLHTIYRESDGYEDPIASCERMRAATGNDFPDHEHHIIGNERAREITGDRRMKEWFGIGPSDERVPEEESR